MFMLAEHPQQILYLISFFTRPGYSNQIVTNIYNSSLFKYNFTVSLDTLRSFNAEKLS